jgi:AraC-like DNA-binding protein
VARPTALEAQWRELMFLCQQESRFRADQNHPKLLKFVTARVDELAREIGFSDRQIRTREFRAERDDRRILRVLTDRGPADAAR